MYQKKAIFTGAAMGMLLFGISLITLGSVAATLKAKFNLENIDAGTLFSILPFGILTGSLIFGPICDRYGYRWLLILSCIGMLVGFQGIANAPTLGILKICVFVFGVAGGIINGSTNAIVADTNAENPGPSLSLLGVFFGIGALGMPLLLGVFADIVQPLTLVSIVGFLALLPASLYLLIQFPKPKISGTAEKVDWRILLKWILLFIAFFLFCQSSLEAILNNWTISYLTSRNIMTENLSLYGLSIHICGMIIMRLLMGSVFKSVSLIRIMWAGLILLVVGVAMMHVCRQQWLVMTGLFLSGAGLAQGFPVMLAIVSEQFRKLSGTAFSVVMVVALLGNIAVNYLMGYIAHHYGIEHLTTVAYAEIAIMFILFTFIIQQFNSTKKQTYAGNTVAQECTRGDEQN